MPDHSIIIIIITWLKHMLCHSQYSEESQVWARYVSLTAGKHSCTEQI